MSAFKFFSTVKSRFYKTLSKRRNRKKVKMKWVKSSLCFNHCFEKSSSGECKNLCALGHWEIIKIK